MLFGQSYQIYGENSYRGHRSDQYRPDSGLDKTRFRLCRTRHLPAEPDLHVHRARPLRRRTTLSRRSASNSKPAPTSTAGRCSCCTAITRPAGYRLLDPRARNPRRRLGQIDAELGAARLGRYDLDVNQFDQTRFGVGYVDDCLLLALNYFTSYTYTGRPDAEQHVHAPVEPAYARPDVAGAGRCRILNSRRMKVRWPVMRPGDRRERERCRSAKERREVISKIPTRRAGQASPRPRSPRSSLLAARRMRAQQVVVVRQRPADHRSRYRASRQVHADEQQESAFAQGSHRQPDRRDSGDRPRPSVSASTFRTRRWTSPSPHGRDQHGLDAQKFDAVLAAGGASATRSSGGCAPRWPGPIWCADVTRRAWKSGDNDVEAQLQLAQARREGRGRLRIHHATGRLHRAAGFARRRVRSPQARGGSLAGALPELQRRHPLCARAPRRRGARAGSKFSADLPSNCARSSTASRSAI